MGCALFFQEGANSFIDFFWVLPHGDVAALLDGHPSRTLDGLMEALSHGRWKDEVSFPPDEEGGMINAGEEIL